MDEATDPTGTAWLPALFETIDRRDAAAFQRFLTEDCEFRFGNAPTVSGRREIGSSVADFFKSVAGLSHEIQEIIPAGKHVVCHGRVCYTRLNGSALSVPFANLFNLRGGLIQQYLIFADISSLYST